MSYDYDNHSCYSHAWNAGSSVVEINTPLVSQTYLHLILDISFTNWLKLSSETKSMDTLPSKSINEDIITIILFGIPYLTTDLFQEGLHLGNWF